jgi:hypothetical protein
MSEGPSQNTVKQALQFLAKTKDLPSDKQKRFARDIGQALGTLVKASKSFIPALGSFVHVRNEPFTRNLPAMLEDVFSTRIVPRSLLKTARQVGKSTSSAVKTIIMSAIIPFFQTLTVTPQWEMTRRYSSNYIRPLLEYSPVGAMMLNSNCEKNVLQRTLTNQSMMHFSFAFLDCDRVRGIPADRVHADEVQDIDPAFLPEIERTMDRSKWRISDYSGTPKTFDNTMHGLWEKCSQGEWLIQCDCKYTNNPHVEADGFKMVGDKTLVCAKCANPIDANSGYWHHEHNERMNDFVGWHIPQIILPFHYENARNWQMITRAIAGGVSPRILYNEIFGESYDFGTKLVTETDLKRASVLPIPMAFDTARRLIRSYMFRVVGIDWGGRGKDELSMTKLAVIGMRPDGRCDVLWGENLSRYTDPGAEVHRVMEVYKAFNCNMLAHDAAGTAGMRDVLMSHSGFPMEHVMPISYVSAWAQDMMTYHEPNNRVRWAYYSLDKTRSLALTAECIKHGYLFFPQYESIKHLASDFLALVEEKSASRRGSDVYLIRRAQSLSDDWAHAVNLALMAIFHTQGTYPDLVNAVRVYDEATLREFHPDDPSMAQWNARNPADDLQYL